MTGFARKLAPNTDFPIQDKSLPPSMYIRTEPVTTPVHFTFEGRPMQAQAGETVAAALLAGNVGAFRSTPVSGANRAPYCMMGACFECLVTIDGLPNRQACMTEIRDGMVVTRQQGAA